MGQLTRNWDLPTHRFLASAKDVVPFEVGSLSCLSRGALVDYPHRHDFHEILLVESGSGVHVIDFVAYSVTPPQLFLVAPGQVHYWRQGETVEGRVILFKKDFLVLATGARERHDGFSMMPFERHPSMKLARTDADVISRLFDELIQEFDARQPKWISVVRSYLHILLVVLKRLGHPEPANGGSGASALVSRFKQMVAEHSTSERSVRAYARRLGVSRGHLSNTVKQMTGQNPRQIIQQQLVLEAKRLLAHSDLTAAEIAYRLGFDDPSYFGRFFRREACTSPGYFRRTCRSHLAC